MAGYREGDGEGAGGADVDVVGVLFRVQRDVVARVLIEEGERLFCVEDDGEADGVLLDLQNFDDDAAVVGADGHVFGDGGFGEGGGGLCEGGGRGEEGGEEEGGAHGVVHSTPIASHIELNPSPAQPHRCASGWTPSLFKGGK